MKGGQMFQILAVLYQLNDVEWALLGKTASRRRFTPADVTQFYATKSEISD
jgi:hypothetical protein